MVVIKDKTISAGPGVTVRVFDSVNLPDAHETTLL